MRWMMVMMLALVSLAPATAHHDGTAAPPQEDCSYMWDEQDTIQVHWDRVSAAWDDWFASFQAGESDLAASGVGHEDWDAYYAQQQTSADAHHADVLDVFWTDTAAEFGACHTYLGDPSHEFSYEAAGKYWFRGQPYQYGELLDSTSASSSSSTSPPGTSSGPGDGTAAGDGTASNDPCADMWNEHKEQIDGLYADNQAAWDKFFDDMNKEAQSRSGSGSTDAERDLWMREMDDRAARLHDDLVQTFWAQAQDLLGDCAWHLGEPGRQFYYHGEYASDGTKPSHPDGTAAAPGTDHPYADDPAFHAIEEEAWQIRRDCESRIWALWQEHDQKSWSSHEAQDADRRAIEEQVHAIERDCEAKIRALYEGFYQEHHEEDFEEHFGSLQMYWDEAEQRIVVRGKFLELRGIPEDEAMTDVSCRGSTYIDYLRADGDLGEFRPQQTDSGTALNVFDASGKLTLGIHDNERCVINLRSTADVPSGILDLADRLDCAPNAAGDMICQDGDVKIVVLLHDGSIEESAGNQLLIRGSATFIVKSGQAVAGHAFGSHYEDAVEQKFIGAEVKIASGSNGLRIDAAPLGDMEVRVEGQKDEVTAYVESEAGIGKTVALSIDESLIDAERLALKAWAVEDGEESPLPVQEASSLEDVLDPHDDEGETIEYWVVKDKNGWQVLVSFPHFSEKRVTVTPETVDSAGLAVDVPGPGGILVASLLVGLVAAVRRRL